MRIVDIFCPWLLQELTTENSQLAHQTESAEQRLLTEVAAVQAELTQERLLCGQLKASLEQAQLDVDRLTEAEGHLRSALQSAEELKVICSRFVFACAILFSTQFRWCYLVAAARFCGRVAGKGDGAGGRAGG